MPQLTTPICIRLSPGILRKLDDYREAIADHNHHPLDNPEPRLPGRSEIIRQAIFQMFSDFDSLSPNPGKGS